MKFLQVNQIQMTVEVPTKSCFNLSGHFYIDWLILSFQIKAERGQIHFSLRYRNKLGRNYTPLRHEFPFTSFGTFTKPYEFCALDQSQVWTLSMKKFLLGVWSSNMSLIRDFGFDSWVWRKFYWEGDLQMDSAVHDSNFSFY